MVLCDVSGSMELVEHRFLQFLFALQHSGARVDTFLFATHLSHVTSQLAAANWRAALDAVSQAVTDWDGGTRIGASLAEFVAKWGSSIDRRTIVIVLSDGWDTGDPRQLADAMAAIRRRARRVIWLNPLLGTAGYEPKTRGMQAALPHLDEFLPAHDLESIAAVVRSL
jgi:uncharacterized protein with von Willebrand factor type A (vWA) domain